MLTILVAILRVTAHRGEAGEMDGSRAVRIDPGMAVQGLTRPWAAVRVESGTSPVHLMLADCRGAAWEPHGKRYLRK